MGDVADGEDHRDGEAGDLDERGGGRVGLFGVRLEGEREGGQGEGRGPYGGDDGIGPDERPPPPDFARIALEYGLRFNAMRREWAEWAAEQIR
jgi:hypothetical protein